MPRILVCERLVPSQNATRAEGDVHPGGNPHFQLDPIRMGRAAELIAVRLGELDPSHVDAFKAAAGKIKSRLEKKSVEWQARIKKTGITEVVSYHKTLNYFF
jgi:zinc/manganese transport system substrate-binding protein